MKFASGFIIAFIVLATLLSAESTGPIQAAVSIGAWPSPKTSITVSGAFLDWFKRHGDLDYLGHPTSELMWNPTTGLLTQQFERGALELRNNRAQPQRVVDQLWPDNDPPVAAEAPNDANYAYFAADAGGLGHAVRNYVLDNGHVVNIGFKDFFERCGGVETFGYPKEEARKRGTRWTQRFQGALLQYFAENDADIRLRPWKVQPALIEEIEWLKPAPPPQPNMMPVQLMFMNSSGNEYVLETRQAPQTERIMRATLDEMLKGPRGSNLRATVDPRTQIRSLNPARGIVWLNLSYHFLNSENPGWAVHSIAQALTLLPGVTGVRFYVEDKPLERYWGAEFAKVFTR